MTERLVDRTLRAFSDDLSSESAVPGGGSAAAYAGALGIAMATPGTASDIGVGALMAEAALRGASLNVMINLASLKDPAQVKALSEDLDRALDGAEAQRKRITDFVETRIAR